MRINEISPKAVEFFKKNKKYFCVATAGTLIFSYSSALASENQKNNEQIKPSKANVDVIETPQYSDKQLVDMAKKADGIVTVSVKGKSVDIDTKTADFDEVVKTLKEAVSAETGLDTNIANYPTYIVKSCWKPTEDYSSGSGYLLKENREYERTVWKLIQKEDLNEEELKKDYERITLAITNDYSWIKKYFEVLDVSTEKEVFTAEEEKTLNTRYDVLTIEGNDDFYVMAKALERKKDVSNDEIYEKLEDVYDRLDKMFWLGGAAFIFMVIFIAIASEDVKKSNLSTGEVKDAVRHSTLTNAEVKKIVSEAMEESKLSNEEIRKIVRQALNEYRKAQEKEALREYKKAQEKEALNAEPVEENRHTKN